MGEGQSGPEAGQPTSGKSRLVTVTEAAWILDTTVAALRKRVQRGTIAHERDEYGRVWILVDSDRTRQDTTSQRPDTDQPHVESEALISEMCGRIEDLRAQLEAERQAHAEARRLLLSALEKIPPAIEAPGSPERDAEEPMEATASEPSGGPQTATERPRGLWQRLFGG